MSAFKNPALKQLTDQLRFSPPAKRQEQLARAEKLLSELDPAKSYPYQYVCFRVTDFRSEAYPSLLIAGAELDHDLRLLIRDLAPSTPAMPAEALAEPVLTLGEISKQLNVSTKTIRRWRKCGLVGVRVVRDGRRQVAFTQSVVDRFLATHRERVERGGKFSQLTEDEKHEILRRAQRLARLTVGSLTEISRRIARRLGRSQETVRYTIKNFDREHPEQAIFPRVTGVLDAEAKQVIYNSFRRGIAVETLAKGCRRTRSSMYRVINEVRAQRLLEHPLEYIHHESFDDPAQTEQILSPMPDLEEFEAKRSEMKVPKDVPMEFASLYEVPLLTKEQEQHQFRKLNYLKYLAAKRRDKLIPARARTEELDEIEELQHRAQEIKALLVSCNMRLVVAIAKRHANQTDNIFELVSDGNMSLLRAVEKFDYSRGNKFSTYASWAIMKNFARSIPEEKHRRERYVTGNEELFDASPDMRTDEQECLASAEQAAYRVNRLLEYLDPRERQIIRMRAGLDDGRKPMTLEEIGQQMGITKERVRQLNVRIMAKLRTIAKDQQVDEP